MILNQSETVYNRLLSAAPIAKGVQIWAIPSAIASTAVVCI